MLMLDSLPRLKREVEEITRGIDRAAGEEAQIVSRMTAEYGVSRLKDAKAARDRMGAAERKAARVYSAVFDRFLRECERRGVMTDWIREQIAKLKESEDD